MTIEYYFDVMYFTMKKHILNVNKTIGLPQLAMSKIVRFGETRQQLKKVVILNFD